ncbi:MAG TPA: S9 family peptidase, partial [Armatimonadota bacterium]|nr:S9 family peptidase [Armatimonadota bacterium]
TDQYIPRIKWTKSDGVLSVLRLNRLQNKMEYLLANAADGTSKVMHTEENERYLDADDSLTFLADRKHFIILSERSGWRHIHLFDMNGKHIRQITSGSWDVIDYYGYSDEAGRVYYSAARPTPLNRTIFSIKLDGTDEQVLSETNGCSSASFSKGFKYYINSHSTANTPPQFTLHNSSGKLVRVLEDNSVLKETLKQYYIPKKEFFSFKTSEGIELNGWMMKPEGFDPKKKYPVLMTVYGGPNSQTVTDSWNLGWEHYVMQHGYIIASVDGRGTGSRGEEFRKCTYQQLGKYEVIDQIEAAKYLGTLPYVDATRIGIFGWSYGGFMACGCILRGADVFKAAVAVASVTNFRYYDTIYTERYMGLPQDNLDGYDQNAPLSHADKLTGKLLLVHGVTDDNVHYQNSLELCEALVKAGKHFEVHFLPNRDHGISGGNTHLHLFGRMTDFLCDNL